VHDPQPGKRGRIGRRIVHIGNAAAAIGIIASTVCIILCVALAILYRTR
jgi:hypothetical protein